MTIFRQTLVEILDRGPIRRHRRTRVQRRYRLDARMVGARKKARQAAFWTTCGRFYGAPLSGLCGWRVSEFGVVGLCHRTKVAGWRYDECPGVGARAGDVS